MKVLYFLKDSFLWLFKFRTGSKEGNIARTSILFAILMVCLIGKCSCHMVADCLEQKALRYTGIREATGANDGLYVELFLKRCNLSAGYAWCGCFNYSMHLDCGVGSTNLPSNPAWAASWAEKTVWRKGDDAVIIQKGMTVQLWSESKKRIAHVGYVVYKNEDSRGWYVVYCSGNTRDAGNTIQPGDGIHMVKLYLTTIHSISDWRQSNAKYHVVKPTETLYRLSIMYNIPVDELKRLNGLDNNGIWIGQELKVAA